MQCECGHEIYIPKYCPECGKPINLPMHGNHPNMPKIKLVKVQSQDKIQSELITVKELEEFLGISQPRAYELIHSKGFPTVKIGRNYRVDKTRLLAMIESGYTF
ncbi:hypothetical protein KL86SPO_50227 [uncultured Sporomusa sp.]|uniref:Helix-turn-helix domain-containing protein n=1 Tax=uncultured Sporomusa sp. TaxID=307249 RepID=A0A212LY68_9FIRM|nr:helix-turn-helix domain-containing protein [uncultured Sporomusa sp.]SCM82456.1 hypothetical protein KL86SPO_50227 [uncultured Sporomusa sp.]